MSGIPRKLLPSTEVLKAYFNYEPGTGLVYWKISPAFKIKAGDMVTVKPYAKVRIDGERFFVHRVVWKYMTGSDPVNFIDHINGDPSDNSWKNLRDVVHSVNLQNQKNKHTNNTTGFQGVCKVSNSEKFQAAIRINKKHIYLGSYETKEEASKVYQDYKQSVVSGT